MEENLQAEEILQEQAAAEAVAESDEQPESEMEIERSFTQEEVNKIISERLQSERKKSQAILAETVSTEKAAAESSTRESLFQEVESREAAVTQRELTAYAKERLAGIGLPISLIGLVETVSNEKIDESIAGMENIFRRAVKESVGQRLGAKSPMAWEPGTFDEQVKRAMGL